VYAASARTYALAFDYFRAAEDYLAAFQQVERWDRRLAWQYKLAAADMLQAHGAFKGVNAPLEKAIAIYGEAFELAPRTRAPLDWALTQNNLGEALTTLGGREGGAERLKAAIAALRLALEERSRD